MAKQGLTELINTVLDKAKIEEVVGEYVDLQRQGSNYTGLCPFHQDSNPSMSVSPNKKIFKCFSCGAGGNVITFVQNKEGISFIDALKKLADKYGINWKDYLDEIRSKPVPQDVKKIWEINRAAFEFYKFNLESEMLDPNSEVQKYVTSRKLDKEDIQTFELGYAKPGASVTTFLLNKGYSEIDLLKAGVAKQTDSGVQDYFYNRLLFSIHDGFGNIIGFSGRQLENNKQYAKYLNTPETKVFKKGSFLYNLHRARGPISLSKKVIIVEGYMDVISFNKIGINNVVASMGTAFTDKQTELLKKQTNNVLLALDRDTAGINATISIGKNLIMNDIFNVNIFINKKTKDIDELVTLIKDKNVVIKYMESNIVHFLDFYTELLIKPEQPNYDVIDRFVEFLKYVSPGKAYRYIKKIADKYDLRADYYASIQEEEHNKLNSGQSTPKRHFDPETLITQRENTVKYAEDLQEQLVTKHDEDVLKKQIKADETRLILYSKNNLTSFNRLRNTNYVFTTSDIKKLVIALFKYYSLGKETLDIDAIMSLLKTDDDKYRKILEYKVTEDQEIVGKKIDEYVKKLNKLTTKQREIELLQGNTEETISALENFLKK